MFNTGNQSARFGKRKIIFLLAALLIFITNGDSSALNFSDENRSVNKERVFHIV
jgi:hypothetical protein